MIYWARKHYLTLLGYSFSILFLVFFIFNLFFSNKSILSLFVLDKKINDLKNISEILQDREKEMTSKVKLLKSENLDPDYISELAQKNIGLIKQDRILVKID